MAQCLRTLQSTDDRSILLNLYQELREVKDDTGARHQIQNQIDQIIAQNFLVYINRT